MFVWLERVQEGAAGLGWDGGYPETRLEVRDRDL